MLNIKIKILILLFILNGLYFVKSQTLPDSLVLFSDLKFHSDFEKNAITQFVLTGKDTFMLFLAIDESMNIETAEKCSVRFNNFLSNPVKLKDTPVYSKKQIKKIFQWVHDGFLQKYNELEFFPQIFLQGNYNCVTASMLYSLIFNRFNIPYKIIQSQNHVYLVANPGVESIIIETTDPGLVGGDISRDYKYIYVKNLRAAKMISESEIRKKSVDELFHERHYKGTEAVFINFSGFEYFNKGLKKLKDQDISKAYEYIQKAYFFFPDEQVKEVLYSTLLKKIKTCRFRNVTDIDYLVHLSRFDKLDETLLTNAFMEIVNYQLQFTDKVPFCDSIHHRFVCNINKQWLKQEISFSYNLLMGRHFFGSGSSNPYLERAITIKQNHSEANNLFVSHLEKQLELIDNFSEMNDSIASFEKKYNYSFLSDLFRDYRLIAILNEVSHHISYGRIKEALVYLEMFEDQCKGPIGSEHKKLIKSIESVYRAFAVYHFYRNEKKKAQEFVDRGLKLVPGSRFIQTSVY